MARRSSRIAPTRALAAVLLLAFGSPVEAGRGRGGYDPPLAGADGLSQYQELAAVPVPGGVVNAAGGNLLIARRDLSLDTRLGTRAIGAVYNSWGGEWLWSFDVRFDGSSFLDATGASHATGALGPGDAIPGTTWVVVDATTIKSKGGLVFRFDSWTGRLIGIEWVSAPYPRIEYRENAAANRLEIVQCADGVAPCTEVYTVHRDALGRVERITDRAGREASFTYAGSSARIATARDGLDTANGWPGFRYEYSGGRLSALTNSEGERVEYGYVQQGRLTEVRAVGEEDPVHRFSYFGGGSGSFTTRYEDPLGHTTTFRYDGAARVEEVRNPLGERVRYVWSGRRVAERTDASGAVTRWTWVDDDVATAVLPSGNVVAWSYAPDGESRSDPMARPLLVRQDLLGVLEQRAYDAQGRLVAVTNGAGETTSLGYGPGQEVASETSPAGVVTGYLDHGEHGHPTRVARGGNEVTLAYDLVGNLIEGLDRRYDSGPGLGGIVSRSFDADRNVASVLLTGLLDGVLPTGGETLAIEHRSDGRRTGIFRPAGADTEFVYDALGRLAERRERVDGVWRSTLREHDARGLPTAIERPNGMRVEEAWDPAGRLLHRTLRRDGATESAATFAYADGRLASIVDSARAGPETRTYDPAGRVATIAFADGETLAFTYDVRSRVTLAVFTLAGAPVPLRTLGLAYDGADRQTALLDGGVTAMQWSFTAGQLVGIGYGNGLARAFAYDGAGRLAATALSDGAGAVLATTDLDHVDTEGLCGLGRCVTATTETHGSLPSSTAESYLLNLIRKGVF